MRTNFFFIMIILIFFLAPHSSATEALIEQNSDEINPFVGKTLTYDDKLLVSVKDPTALPLKISNYGNSLRNLDNRYFGELYTTGNQILDSDGDKIKINGSTEYSLVNINDNYAIFGDGTYLSFRGENLYRVEPVYHSLIEPVSSDSELNGICTEKWIFLEACFSPTYYYHLNSDLDNFIFVMNSYTFTDYSQSDYLWGSQETRVTTFVYDLEKKEIILSGNINFLGHNQNPGRDYVLIEVPDQNQLVILNRDGTMIEIDRHGENSDNDGYQSMCFSDDFIFGFYRDWSGDYESTYFFIETSSGQKTNLSLNVIDELGYPNCVQSSTTTHMIVDGIPYELSTYRDLILSNDFSEHENMKRYFSCDYSAVGSTHQDKYKSATEKRFIRCNEVEPSVRNSLYFDMETGEYIYTPLYHAPVWVHGNLVILEKQDDCFLWNTNEETIQPIIDLSDSYSCSNILVHDDNVYLNNELSLVAFTSDGRIDLDDQVTYSEQSVVDSLASFLEKTYESSIFTVWVSLILVSIIYLNRRKFKKNLEELGKETSSMIEALKLELIRVEHANDATRFEDRIPAVDAVGSPDKDGFEWITSEGGKNWYRTQGSMDEWIEYAN